MTRRAIPLVAVALLSAGCADRRLMARPEAAPSGTTWLAVWIALALAALVTGVLLTLPAWRQRGGARFAVIVLTLEAGAAVIAGVVLASVAARTWQLLGRPPTATPVDALVRLSDADGDQAFFALMVIIALLLASVVATIAAAAARLAASADPLSRSAASVFLALEAGGCGYAIVRLVLGANGLPYVVPALAFPVFVAAFATCWPRAAAPTARWVR